MASQTSANKQDALERLSLLLQLQRRARKATREELDFIMVNETRALIPYRQAVLFVLENGRLTVSAVSGLDVPNASSPYVQWLTGLAAARLAAGPANQSDRAWQSGGLTREDCAAYAENLEQEWENWLPAHGWWLPLLGSRDSRQGALVLFREQPWREPEAHILSYLADSYGQALGAFSPPPHRAWLKTLGRRWKILALILLIISLYPMRDSVLVPAEVTASRPELVRAPLEGVVQAILVEPNQAVEKGQVLARLDDAQLRSRLLVAQKTLEMARAEYRQLQQQALFTPEAKAGLPLVQGRMEQLAEEVAYVQTLLKRTDIVSQSDGVAVFDDPNAWLGRPVSLGEKIMFVADPAQSELTLYLPLRESLPLEPGDEVLFFPNVAPGSPVEASLSFISYQAAEQSGDSLAYLLRAQFAGEAPRLGLRGTAKVYGQRQPLLLKALRQPLRLARQWLGV